VGAIVVVVALSQFRTRVLDELSTPEAQARWQKWKNEADQPGPVRRQAPKSEEPPMLVLMRDNFAAILVAALTFYSFLFGLAVLLGRGILQRAPIDR